MFAESSKAFIFQKLARSTSILQQFPEGLYYPKVEQSDRNSTLDLEVIFPAWFVTLFGKCACYSWWTTLHHPDWWPCAASSDRLWIDLNYICKPHLPQGIVRPGGMPSLSLVLSTLLLQFLSMHRINFARNKNHSNLLCIPLHRVCHHPLFWTLEREYLRQCFQAIWTIKLLNKIPPCYTLAVHKWMAMC